MRCMFVGMLVAIVAACSANMSSWRWREYPMSLVEYEHSTVRLVREWVRMDVYGGYYDVTAQFAYKNYGPPTTAVMGFPEFAGLAGSGEQAYRGYNVWVDRREAPVTRRIIGGGGPGYHAYWMNEVPFGGRQSRTIRVHFRAPTGWASGQGFAAYDFTGGKWYGHVAQTDLLVVMHGPWTPAFSGTEPPPRLRANRLAFRWTDWEAEQPLRIPFSPTRPGTMAASVAAEAGPGTEGWTNAGAFFLFGVYVAWRRGRDGP